MSVRELRRLSNVRTLWKGRRHPYRLSDKYSIVLGWNSFVVTTLSSSWMCVQWNPSVRNHGSMKLRLIFPTKTGSWGEPWSEEQLRCL